MDRLLDGVLIEAVALNQRLVSLAANDSAIHYERTSSLLMNLKHSALR
jgi:hypothetical protein